MKRNYWILALLITTCTVKSTIMNHIETVKSLLIAQMESKVGSQLILNLDGTLKSQILAIDLDIIVSLWISDIKTNRIKYGDFTRSTLWNYLIRVDTDILNVSNIHGINLNKAKDITVKQSFN